MNRKLSSQDCTISIDGKHLGTAHAMDIPVDDSNNDCLEMSGELIWEGKAIISINPEDKEKLIDVLGARFNLYLVFVAISSGEDYFKGEAYISIRDGDDGMADWTIDWQEPLPDWVLEKSKLPNWYDSITISHS